MSAFWDAYKRPEWQKKRLKIMERARFACEYCDDTETRLHVHHTYYEKGKLPWQYPDESLRCLCETCHKDEHNQRDRLKRLAGSLGSGRLEILIGYAMGLTLEYPEGRVIRPMSAEECMGLEDCFGVSWMEIVDEIHRAGSISDTWLHRRREQIRSAGTKS